MVGKDSTEKYSLSVVNFNCNFAENWIYLNVMPSAGNGSAYHRTHLIKQKHSRNTLRVPLFDWVQLEAPHMLGIRFAVNWQKLKRFEKGSSAQEEIIHVHRKSYLTHRCSSILKTSSRWLFPAELGLRYPQLSHSHPFARSLSGLRLLLLPVRPCKKCHCQGTLTAAESLFLHKTSKQNKLLVK